MQKVRPLAILVVSACMLSLSACSAVTVSHYSQAIDGHLALMRARAPIDKLLTSDNADPALREKLETLMQARAIEAMLREADQDLQAMFELVEKVAELTALEQRAQMERYL